MKTQHAQMDSRLKGWDDASEDMLSDLWYSIMLATTTSYLFLTYVDNKEPEVIDRVRRELPSVLKLQESNKALNYGEKLKDDPGYNKALKAARRYFNHIFEYIVKERGKK